MSTAAKTASAGSTEPLRTGADFLRSLSEIPRALYVAGEKVTNPATHPAFRGGARSMARLFDFAAAPENRDVMTYPSPRDAQPVWRCFQIPRSHEDLRAKRIAAEKWAELTFGLMGRTPDHVANFFAGFAAVPSLFAAADPQFGENVVRYHEMLRDTHAYITYAIVPPQIDRSKPGHQQSDPTLYAGVVKETDAGIYLKGAQQLATGGAYCDYIHLSCIHPLRPGDENYALSVAFPATAPGVKLYSRRAFPLQATNEFDYPLTSRFDETDCLVVLEDVFVPWEHVFCYRNIEICRDQWWKTPSHLYGNHQAQARYATKLRFLMGLAKRMNEATGNDAQPPVQVEMGEIAALASIVDGMLQSQEVMATVDENGVLWPSKAALYSVMALQSEINPRIIDTIRELTGAAMITLPSAEADFESAETADDIARYYRSANTDSRGRAALMQLAWDFIGTEFGNRHQQYEKFYGGASFIIKMNMFRSFDFARAGAMVDEALNLPRLDG